MHYSIIPVTSLQQNCTLAWCSSSRKGVVTDPGGEVERIVGQIQQKEVDVEKILLTHGHFDHVGGARLLADCLQVPIYGPHEADRYWFEGLPQQSAMFGVERIEAFLPDHWLCQGDEIHFGNEVLQVLHCPGHTPGHLVFFHAVDRLALVGDVLFQGSVGRSDLPGGHHPALIRSITEILLPLGDEVQFVPGHGPMSTFGAERLHNPFLSP